MIIDRTPTLAPTHPSRANGRAVEAAFRRMALRVGASALALSTSAAIAHTVASGSAAGAKPDQATSANVSEVVVTASRLDLLGAAATASQGSATQKELALRPIYRVGQLLETVPGLVVTAHSGEGKANQYLIRGFNLDHGTDIANFVDDMPVNRPTNTHGQGYSDMNFLMPELAAGMDYTKGPYYASVGDFGAVASTHTRLLDELPPQMSVSAGTLGDQSLFLGGTRDFGPNDRLLAAASYSHLDGPWKHPDNFHKINAALRYSHGTQDDGYSLTALYDHSHGNLNTDQPERAVDKGLIGRYGTLDPTDGSRSERLSLSGRYAVHGDQWSFDASAYYIHSTMTLWNDFTHYLEDPVNGDQEEQTETRNTWGGQAAYKLSAIFGGIETDTTIGLQVRHDDAYVDRRHTYHRHVLNYCEQPQPLAADGAYVAAVAVAATNGACQADRVNMTDLGPYAENITHWTPWLRSIIGVREEYYQADDHSYISGFSGSGGQTLFQPKGSLVLGPWAKTELYLSAGRGFHSDDVRGVFGTVPLEGEPTAAGKTPLLAAATGEEIGVRTNIISKVSVQVAVFQEDFKSELAYDQDVGQDTASAPSRRQGVEISAQYRPAPWIELNSDLAFSRARYTSDFAAFGLTGAYIANAPSFIGSFGALIDNLGPWFGGVQWRDLGPYPISDGTEFPKDKGYSEVNADAGFKVSRNLKLQISIFNLFNSHANSAAYYYITRLNGEPLAGMADYQVHPLEPISARFSATATF